MRFNIHNFIKMKIILWGVHITQKKGACFGETYLNVYARIPTSSYKIQ